MNKRYQLEGLVKEFYQTQADRLNGNDVAVPTRFLSIIEKDAKRNGISYQKFMDNFYFIPYMRDKEYNDSILKYVSENYSDSQIISDFLIDCHRYLEQFYVLDEELKSRNGSSSDEERCLLKTTFQHFCVLYVMDCSRFA